jgi:hypothetical protein
MHGCTAAAQPHKMRCTMADYLNGTCSVCGKPYHICGDCTNTKSFSPWRTVADSLNCYKIFLILRDYTNGYTIKSEARELLQKCDLSGLENFQKNIKNSILEILDEEQESEDIIE